jgi:hypothetical protein
MILFVLTSVLSILCFFATGVFLHIAVTHVGYPPWRRLCVVLSCVCCALGFILFLAAYSIYPIR